MIRKLTTPLLIVATCFLTLGAVEFLNTQHVFATGLSVVQGPFNGSTTGSVQQETATFGSATTAGNLLVVLVNYNNGASDTQSVMDTAGNTYTQAGTGFTDGAAHHFEIWYAENALANAGTVTVKTNNAGGYIYFSVTVYEVSGADASNPLNTTSTGASGSGSALSTGTITLAASSEIIFAPMEADGTLTSGTCNAGGYTCTAYQTYLGDTYHITSSSEAAVATANGSANWGIFAASFKVAAAASTVLGPPTFAIHVGQFVVKRGQFIVK